MPSATDRPFSIVVLISGNGSNLQAIIDAIHGEELPARIVAVISNRADAFGLQRAQQANIPTEVIAATGIRSRDDYDSHLMACIDRYEPDLIVLAGFMRILSDRFVQHYLARMINIHPSLLPAYKGLDTHRRVLAAAEKEHGATVHYVTPELDSGPIIVQARIPVAENETEAELAQRVHQLEHKIYPYAVGLIAEGRLRLEHQTVMLDGKPISPADVQFRLN